MTVHFVNTETARFARAVFMATSHDDRLGTFIINGTERVIVTQLVRSPSA
jgi:DNA-directed RNA polymerase beta subunit